VRGGIALAADVLTENFKSEEERIQYENDLIFELDVNTRKYYAEKAVKAAEQAATIAVKRQMNLELLNLIQSGYSLEQIEEIILKNLNEIMNSE